MRNDIGNSSGKVSKGRQEELPKATRSAGGVIDKILLFDGGSIGGLFLLVKGYFASVLHQKAGAGDAIW